MTNETKHFTLDCIHYDADRIIDSAGIGYIELRWPGVEAPLARIHYHGNTVPMDVCTYGAPLPLPALEWLLAKAQSGLLDLRTEAYVPQPNYG